MCVRAFSPSFINISTFLHNIKKNICEANKQIHSTLWHLSLIGFFLFSLSLGVEIVSYLFTLLCFAVHTKLFRWIDADFAYIRIRVSVLHLCITSISCETNGKKRKCFEVNGFVDIVSTLPPSMHPLSIYLSLGNFWLWLFPIGIAWAETMSVIHYTIELIFLRFDTCLNVRRAEEKNQNPRSIVARVWFNQKWASLTTMPWFARNNKSHETYKQLQMQLILERYDYMIHLYAAHWI